MGRVSLVAFSHILIISSLPTILCEDPYIFNTWNVKYETRSPLGVPQQVITINEQFPGPKINCTSNNNIVINVFNHLDEPLLFTWNGIQQRKNSWQEGTPGNNCPIPPGTNYTFKFQVKDQIGSFYYYPTTSLHRAAGGFGLLAIHSRALIPIPFDLPEDEFQVFVGDWYAQNHSTLKNKLEHGRSLGRPDGVLINGKGDGSDDQSPMFVMKPKKTYRYRICNVGMKNTINVRFQGHTMKLVEIEGSHTVQNVYDSLDVHLGQSFSVLVISNNKPQDYYIVASTRFSRNELHCTATVRYEGGHGHGPPSATLPTAPEGIAWSLNQFRSFRWSLTASAARPNPQGSYHYGLINITRTIKLVTGPGSKVGGQTRYAVNGISHIDPETPLKLAEYYGIPEKVFKYNVMGDEPQKKQKEMMVTPNVINGTYHNYVEFIFENHDKSIQSWHMSGHAFFAVAIELGRWAPEKRKTYNLIDAVSKHTIHVYPNSWAAVMTTLDNAGMWNLRSLNLERVSGGAALYQCAISSSFSS